MRKPCPLFSVDFILRVSDRATVTKVFGNPAFFERCLRKLAAGDEFILRVTYHTADERLLHESLLRQLGDIFRDKVYFSTSPALPTSDHQNFFCFWTFRPVASLQHHAA